MLNAQDSSAWHVPSALVKCSDAGGGGATVDAIILHLVTDEN